MYQKWKEKKTFLPRNIGHQIFSADEAEDGDAVIFIEDTEGTKHLAQCRPAGGNIVDDQHVLLTDSSAKLFVSLGCKPKEFRHIRTEAALFYILGNGKIVLPVNKVKHLAYLLADLFLLFFRISGPAVFQRIIQVSLSKGIHIKRDVCGQILYQFHLP